MPRGIIRLGIDFQVGFSFYFNDRIFRYVDNTVIWYQPEMWLLSFAMIGCCLAIFFLARRSHTQDRDCQPLEFWRHAAERHQVELLQSWLYLLRMRGEGRSRKRAQGG